MAEQKPRFRHEDCSACHFLGWHDTAEGQFDLYVHWGEVEKTVIARFGDDGPEYYSGLAFAKKIEPLGEALVRAVELGIVSKNVAYPLQLRKLFRDDLAAMELFEEEVQGRVKVLLFESMNEKTYARARYIVQSVWQEFFNEGRVTGPVDEMPGFQIFGGQRLVPAELVDPEFYADQCTLHFEWAEPQFGAEVF
jgi:hypothetical protein